MPKSKETASSQPGVLERFNVITFSCMWYGSCPFSPIPEQFQPYLTGLQRHQGYARGERPYQTLKEPHCELKPYLASASSQRNQTLRHKKTAGFLGSEKYLFILRELQHITEHIFQVTRTFRDLLSLYFPESLLEAKKESQSQDWPESVSSMPAFVLSLALMREVLTVRPVSLNPSSWLVLSS